jgi:hypothetical protein
MRLYSEGTSVHASWQEMEARATDWRPGKRRLWSNIKVVVDMVRKVQASQPGMTEQQAARRVDEARKLCSRHKNFGVPSVAKNPSKVLAQLGL